MKLAIKGGTPVAAKDKSFVKWPFTRDYEWEYVKNSLCGNRHSWGENCDLLQEEWSKWNGNTYTLAVNSGTAALHMCIAGCNIQPGDEVIVTSTSWISSATCILHHNAIPVFVDIDYDTMLIDPVKIEDKITENTKAILAVHYWGLVCEMDTINAIAQKYQLFVIEDACQAHGSLYKGRKAGTLAHCAAFSMNQNKNFSAGEGGLFVTNNSDIYHRAVMLMNFGERTVPTLTRNYLSKSLGWMYRINDLTAAYARARLEYLQRDNETILKNFLYLKELVKDIPGLKAPVHNDVQSTNGYAFVNRFDFSMLNTGLSDRQVTNLVFRALLAEGIPVSREIPLLPEQKVFQSKEGYGKGCPWSCPSSKAVDYDLKQYPNARLSNARSIVFTSFKTGNTVEQLELFSVALHKVIDNFHELMDV